MADFGTCAVDWPLLDEWDRELADGRCRRRSQQPTACGDRLSQILIAALLAFASLVAEILLRPRRAIPGCIHLPMVG